MPTVPRDLTRVPITKDDDFEDRWNAMPPGIRGALQSIEDRRNEFSDMLMNKEGISQSGKLHPPASGGAMLSWKYSGDIPPHTKLSVEAGSKDVKAPSKEEVLGFLTNVESLNPDPNAAEMKWFEDKVQQIMRKPK